MLGNHFLTCDACGKSKVCHPTRAAAEAERARIMAKHPAGYNHALGIYRCYYCRLFHCGARRHRRRGSRSFRLGAYASVPW